MPKIEEEANGDDGLVYECEVTYNGQIVTPLVMDSYEGFLIKCQQHFAKHVSEKRDDFAIDRYLASVQPMGRPL